MLQLTTIKSSYTVEIPIKRSPWVVSFAIIQGMAIQLLKKSHWALFLLDVAVLDMTQTSLQWAVPQTTGTPPAPRYSHSTAMVGTVMMLFFGELQPKSIYSPIPHLNMNSLIYILNFTGLISNVTLDNGVYALDTATWTWLTTYTPDNLQYTKNWLIAPNSTVTPTTTQTTQTSASTTQNATSAFATPGSPIPLAPIIGGTAGGLVLIAAALAGFLFCVRRSKRQQTVNGSQPTVAPYPAQRFVGPGLAAPQQPRSQHYMQGPPQAPLHHPDLPPYPYRNKELDQRRDSGDIYAATPLFQQHTPVVLPLRPMSQQSLDMHGVGDSERQPSLYKPDNVDGYQSKPNTIFRDS